MMDKFIVTYWSLFAKDLYASYLYWHGVVGLEMKYAIEKVLQNQNRRHQ